MKLTLQTPEKTMKAFLKQKPLRSEIDNFKKHLILLLDKINIIEKRPTDESEEHLKNDLRDFLRDTYYFNSNAINTKDKKDLVIHLDKTTNSEVGVIIEAKRPTNINEMVTADNPNKKALHELILYYLDERNNAGNFQLKQLVITNINQWYIIDANHFDKHIYNNSKIKTLYKTYKNDNKTNPWFYDEVSKIIATLDIEIPCVYFDIKEYDKNLRNDNKVDDKQFSALYKILSAQHLLKTSTPNDSNSLNEKFYKELLHIIGLEEAKEGGKNIIRRKKENRSSASLIEVTMDALQSNDPNYIITAEGTTKDERIFNVALELCITWMNRILFLKLMEGQLVNYHEGNKEYKFLNSEKIFDYDELFTLFHNVLAIKFANRKEALKEKYSKVPYLNSSLFDITLLERETIKISALDNRLALNLINTTILKESKKKSTALPTLEYLFQFLDAYDFASEGTDDIREDKKELINASVLGKIFEKINGYKDGSIFTPAFITMYMCKQSIRLAVVEKFNEAISQKDEKLFDTFEDVKNYTTKQFKTTDILKANEIINSLRICDPAVGSGHFLVSALNEIISIKAELGILADVNGNCINNYEIEIINDELIITEPKDKDKRFEYTIQNGKPKTKEIQRLQKTLFREKQSIIENCLFGVDINPNSVKICSLRLWIELLKNAYYKEETNYLELETLPNIDINIKCGNSLLSRFALKENLSKSLKSIKYTFDDYKKFVSDYKNATDKDEKKGYLKIISDIKDTITATFFQNSKENKSLARTRGEYQSLVFNRVNLFGDKLKGEKYELEKKRLELLMERDEKKIADIKNNIVFKNAFEWRFEFPEVLNNDGEFEGFDLIIGNPPYIRRTDLDENIKNIYETKYMSAVKQYDLYLLFNELGINVLKKKGYLSFINPMFFTNEYGTGLRKFLLSNNQILQVVDISQFNVFGNVSTYPSINLIRKIKIQENKIEFYSKENIHIDNNLNLKNPLYFIQNSFLENLGHKILFTSNQKQESIIKKMDKTSTTIESIFDSQRGIPNTKIDFTEDGLYRALKSTSVKKYIYDDQFQKVNTMLSTKVLQELFLNDLLILPRTVMKLQAALKTKNEMLIILDRIYFLKVKPNLKTNLKYVLALLNSKLYNFWFEYYYSSTKVRGGYFDLRGTQINSIPIFQPTETEADKFQILVEKIIEQKQQGKDTTTLEAKIDELVYKLYDLTAEEIKIVEEN